eukprot:scaffold24720_cov17-Tisochrysis_lutea.AAC.1
MENFTLAVNIQGLQVTRQTHIYNRTNCIGSECPKRKRAIASMAQMCKTLGMGAGEGLLKVLGTAFKTHIDEIQRPRAVPKQICN